MMYLLIFSTVITFSIFFRDAFLFKSNRKANQYLTFLLLMVGLQYTFVARQAQANDYNTHLFGCRNQLAFVILSHVRVEDDDKLWRRCHHSIREFYPDVPIVIIDDNSIYPLSDASLTNTVFIRSEYPGAGEFLPYYYLLKYKFANKMIVLHDSMLLRRHFTKMELENSIKFHWDFEHNWDNDLLINMLLSHLKHSDELIDYNVNQKQLWKGCFGAASMINLRILESVESKYSLSSLKEVVNHRSIREAFERVFALIMFKEHYVGYNNCSNFGDIHSQLINFTYIDDVGVEYLKQNYPAAIIKTWRGR